MKIKPNSEKQILNQVLRMMDRPGDVFWIMHGGRGGPVRQAADWAYLADAWHHLFDEGYFVNRDGACMRREQLRARDIILSMRLSA